jgi:ADP-heptose:LPS heptosyltransferase
MKKLVIFEFHLLGDAVMSLPFLRAARSQFDVFVFCSPQAAKAYELVFPPERIFRAELVSWKPGRTSAAESEAFQRACAKIRALKADIGVTVWADVRVHLLMRSLGLPERIGFEMNERNYYAHHLGWRRRNLRIGRTLQTAARLVGQCPLTMMLERHAYEQHHILDWVQLGESLGLAIDLDQPWLGPPAMDVTLPAPAQPFFARNAGRKIWLLHPGAAREWRRWLHFQELIDTTLSPVDAPLVVLEDPSAPGVAPKHGNCLLWPMSSLTDFVALVAHSDRILCNDSAACHIGAALKKQVIALFSSGSSNWFAPYSERTLVESFRCPFRPCLDRCQMPRYVCLDDLTLDRVTAAVAPLVASGS